MTHSLKNNTMLSWDLLAGWRHIWEDRSFDSTASFNGYGVTFKSRSDISGRDGMLAQIGVHASNAKGYFAQLDFSTELFRSETKSFSGDIIFGLKF